MVKNNYLGMIIYTAKALEPNPPTRSLMFWHVTELQKRHPYLHGINSKILWNERNACAEWFDNEL